MSSTKLLWLLPLAALGSCAGSGAGNKEYDRSAPAAVENFTAQTDSGAVISARSPINSSQRKMIHTADFRCKVANVFSAATSLEQLVKSVGGIVQESHMTNSDYDTKTAYYTHDSLWQTRIYTTTAQLTLRVPAAYLDSVVNAIPGLSSFIDTRTLKQSDVTYQYLANELKNQAGNGAPASGRAMQLAKRSHDPIEVQEYEESKQEQKITRKIENMSLLDNVNYATVTVTLLQPEQVFVQTVVNTDYYTQAPFLLQCRAALDTGWELVKALIILFVRIWPLFLLFILGYFTYKRVLRRPVAIAKK